MIPSSSSARRRRPPWPPPSPPPAAMYPSPHATFSHIHCCIIFVVLNACSQHARRLHPLVTTAHPLRTSPTPTHSPSESAQTLLHFRAASQPTISQDRDEDRRLRLSRRRTPRGRPRPFPTSVRALVLNFRHFGHLLASSTLIKPWPLPI